MGVLSAFTKYYVRHKPAKQVQTECGAPFGAHRGMRSVYRAHGRIGVYPYPDPVRADHLSNGRRGSGGAPARRKVGRGVGGDLRIHGAFGFACFYGGRRFFDAGQRLFKRYL